MPKVGESLLHLGMGRDSLPSGELNEGLRSQDADYSTEDVLLLPIKVDKIARSLLNVLDGLPDLHWGQVTGERDGFIENEVRHGMPRWLLSSWSEDSDSGKLRNRTFRDFKILRIVLDAYAMETLRQCRSDSRSATHEGIQDNPASSGQHRGDQAAHEGLRLQ